MSDEQPRTPQQPTQQPSQPQPESPWRRLARVGRPRPTKANLAATALALLLGFALATQVQSQSRRGLESLRTTDLVRILDDQNTRSDRLDADARKLQATRDELVDGSQQGQAAVKAAQERLDTLGILAGTAKATGPGVTITVSDPGGKVTAAMLLDVVQELRDAGAEAIQVGPARVTAGTWFAPKDGALYASDARLSAPYLIRAIGDPATMDAAMRIPGGVVESMKQEGATATVSKAATITVDALTTPAQPRHAQPVPAPTTRPTP
ncbi:DUF881 domain-containing protein [Arsenicicoccus sp. oral taxon 190]|uniref:DUF881 domain-containing protein n=1 Tax=Arsenicicoccus sp. oral taxon 190 TaxID=1658671 RepID=UPI000679EFC2|nr:DUF881 domain-containing protein [Arsenicicoccus sp. oral taxon 190]AKT51846.1 hypothetical protein ADJ73_12205 [Arsenicicoccus sp. oral taxon 190]